MRKNWKKKKVKFSKKSLRERKFNNKFIKKLSHLYGCINKLPNANKKIQCYSFKFAT